MNNNSYDSLHGHTPPSVSGQTERLDMMGQTTRLDNFALATPSERIRTLTTTYGLGDSQEFLKSQSIDALAMPLQGYKFHISAKDTEDFARLCEIAIPEFERLGVHYKIVKPELFDAMQSSAQMGKHFTIYTNASFNFEMFSKELQAVLCEDLGKGILPPADMPVTGRIAARYGRFKGTSYASSSFLTTPDGKVCQDQRGYSALAPFQTKGKTAGEILNFYSEAQKRYSKSGDKKTYLQEVYTMAECDGRQHSYVMYEFDKNDIPSVSSRLNSQTDPYGLSCVAYDPEKSDKAILCVHSTALGSIPTLAQGCTRPMWDIREHYYKIAPENVELAKYLVKGVQYQMQSDMIKVVELSNGKYAIKCDSALAGQFFAEVDKFAKEQFYRLELKEMNAEKSPLLRAWEKLTGKTLEEKDITYERPEHDITSSHTDEAR